jgi:DNA invertase Pin-like site-specific DNA recombinase
MVSCNVQGILEMPTVGYARVSSHGQSLEVQREKLKALGVDKLFEEKKSGVDSERKELKRCLEYLREGDTLVVTKIDRMARSAGHFHEIMKTLVQKGVTFKAIDDPEADMTSRSGKLLLGILALIAEFENDIRKERQLDGIAKAKKQGVKFGRKLEITDAVVEEIKGMRRDDGLTIPQIMKAKGLSKASIYRALGR